MPAIRITDLNNAKVDVDFIADVANSPNPTAVDRLGRTRKTLEGALETLMAVNPRGAWAAATAYALKDLVLVSDVTYICTIPHTSAGAFATDLTAGRWAIYQGITPARLAESDGSELVGHEADVAGAVTQTLFDRLARTVGASDLGKTGGNTLSNLVGIIPNRDGVEYVAISCYNSDTKPNIDRLYRYDETIAKSEHNGGDIISPTVPWDGLKGATHAAWQAGTGETDPTGSGCWVLQNASHRIPASVFGMTADSNFAGSIGTDNSDMWQLAMDRASALSKRLLIDQAGYYLSSTEPYMPVNLEMQFAPDAYIRYDGTRALKCNTGAILWSPRFVGSLINDNFAMYAQGGMKNITVYDPILRNCGMFLTNEGISYAAADWVTKSNISKNINIWNPSIDVDTLPVGVNVTSMLAIHCSGFHVHGGCSKGASFGLMYWGGDSAFGADGAKTNVRKVENVTATNFSCEVYSAGCWGSMGGEGILFDGCYALALGPNTDVGFDHEGTVSAKNIGCTAIGFENGNFVTYAGFTSVESIGCTSIQAGGKPHIRNYNSSQAADSSGDISFIGGELRRMDGTTGLCIVDDSGGCFKSFRMIGTKVRDTRFEFTANNQGSVTLDVDMIYKDASVLATMINIVNNASQRNVYDIKAKVTTEGSGSFNGAAKLVSVNTNSFNLSQLVKVHDCFAPDLPIEFIEQGANGGVSGTIHCHENIVSATTKTNSGAKNLTIVRSDHNYTVGGTTLTL